MYTITMVDNDYGWESVETYDNFEDFHDALKYYGACWDGKTSDVVLIW